MKKLIISTFMLVLLLAYSCKKDDKSSENDILSFSLTEQADTAIIDKPGKQVIIKVKEGTDLSALKPVITLSEGAKVSPASGSTVNFTVNPVKFVVTAEDGTKAEWLVTVNVKIEKKVVANLNNREITSIVVDASNTAWIGTDTGLYKSVTNGYEQQDISIKVKSLYFEKSSGTLWIGTISGLVKGSVSNGQITMSQISPSNLSNSEIMSAYVDSTSKRWFGTTHGLTLNKGTNWKKENFIHNSLGNFVPMDIENAVITAIVAGNGNYYFATTGYGLFRATGYDESLDAFTGATSWSSPYNGEAATDSVFAAIIDSKGNLWFGSTNGVQRHINHNDPKSDNDYFIDELQNKRVHAIAETSKGAIYVGTEKGLAVYNGTEWVQLVADYTVTAIAFLSDGTVLVGTKKGLVRI